MQQITVVNLNTDGASPGGANTAAMVQATNAFLATLDAARRAAGFGLMHCLAFAALLGDLGRGSLLADLFGFNLGIELTQLIVVALLMPSLLVLSRTRLYPGVRITAAGLGVVLAAAWLAERTTLMPANPLAHITDALVEHPFTIAAAAAVSWTVPGLRATTARTPSPPVPVTAERPAR